MGRHVWAITKKQNNHWIRWINYVYLKGHDWGANLLSIAVGTGKRFVKSKTCWSRKVCNLISWTWKNTLSKLFITSWQLMRTKFTGLINIVWNRLAVPKHSFCSWLTMQLRLKTKERLKKVGICDNDTCVLCNQGSENHEHLFFYCSFSSTILAGLLIWMHLPTRHDNFFKLMAWFREGRVCPSF